MKGVSRFLDVEARESEDEREDDEERDLDIIDDEDDDDLVQTLRALRSIRTVDANADDRDKEWTAFVGRAVARAQDDREVQSTPDDDAPPRLWRIPVKRGREEAIVSSLTRKVLFSDGEDWLFIRSIIGRKTFAGSIVVETDTIENAQKLCAGVAGVLGHPSQMPIEEAWSWITIRPYLPLPGSWVRITDDPLHGGDVGWVYAVTQSGKANVLVLPRIDRTRSYDQPRPSQKARQKARTCPAQGLLTIEEAIRIFGVGAVERLEDTEGGKVIPREDYYQITLGTRWCTIFYGFLMHRTLDIESTSPSDAELAQFYSSESFVKLGADPDCRQAFAQLAASRLQAGHRVRVAAGELAQMTGTVQQVAGQAASVALDDLRVSPNVVEFPILQLRALFMVGDYVKIVCGKYLGEHGFITDITPDVVTLYERRKPQLVSVAFIELPKKSNSILLQFIVPVNCVNFYSEPRVIGRSVDAVKVAPVALENPLKDPLVGRRVRIIGDDVFKNYEGFVKRRLDNDPTKMVVELAARTAQHMVSRVVIPLAHLADWRVRDDVTFTSLADEPSKKTGRPSINPTDFPLSSQPLVASIPVPGMSLASSSRAAATPAWSPSAAISSTPAWNPSSRSPGHQAASDASILPNLIFPFNPYITSVLLPDDLRIKVVIHNSHPRPGKRGWKGGQLEGSRAVWRKGDHREAGMAKVTIDGRQTYTLPEECVRPCHPDQKGRVLVIDPQHPKYCQQFIIMSFKEHKTQCILRAKDDHSRARPQDHPNASNRFTIPVTSLAVISCIFLSDPEPEHDCVTGS
ncbi:hypothetical protein H0H92_002537 [Tricholoma furcatifolium]|nr:hypothetical protein H0H92_002537 [Tricholoma furcatifolium]